MSNSIVIAGSIIGSMALSQVISMLMPKLRFKSDKPLDSYTGYWVRFIPVIGLILGFSFAILVIAQELSIVWLTTLIPLAAILAVFAMTDWKYHRLPNGIMVILYALTAISIPVIAIYMQDWGIIARAGIAFGISVIIFFILAMTGAGGGDLKLIPLVFAIMSAISWEVGLSWILVGWLGAGVYAFVQAIVQRSFRGNVPMIPGFTLGTLLLVPFLSLSLLSTL